MKVSIEIWQVKELFNIKDTINEQPRYQRGDVWKDRKKSLLIDSIMRNVDIPKLYLRKLNKGAYQYEVADGQQRLNAIFKFKSGGLSLPENEDKGLDLSKVNGQKIGGLTYDTLPKEWRDHFDNYDVTVAIIQDATNYEIRTLFGRLQEGEPLVPAEKRNAIISSTGMLIDNFALNHKFFLNSYIPEERYKRQDYMAHGVALIAYENNEDLKANLLLKLYLDKGFKLTDSLQNKISIVLDHLAEIDAHSKIKIYKKFHFVDFFWFLFKEVSNKTSIDYEKMAKEFDSFEEKRLSHQDKPNLLIENRRPTPSEKNLYEYIMAFRYEGAATESIDKRNRVFTSLFNKFIK